MYIRINKKFNDKVRGGQYMKSKRFSSFIRSDINCRHVNHPFTTMVIKCSYIINISLALLLLLVCNEYARSHYNFPSFHHLLLLLTFFDLGLNVSTTRSILLKRMQVESLIRLVPLLLVDNHSLVLLSLLF